MWRVVFKVYGLQILGSGLLKLLADLAGFVGPLVIRFIVQYVAENKNKKGDNLSVDFELSRDQVSNTTFYLMEKFPSILHQITKLNY